MQVQVDDLAHAQADRSVRGLQAEPAVVVKAGESADPPPSAGQAAADDPASAVQTVHDSPVHGGQAGFVVDFQPNRQPLHQRLAQPIEIDGPAGGFHQRRGRLAKIAAEPIDGEVGIDPDAHHDGRRGARLELAEDAGDFAAVDQHIVGPLDRPLDRGGAADRFGDGEPGGKGQGLVVIGRLAERPGDREPEPAARAPPGPLSSPDPGGLFLGDHQQRCRRVGPRPLPPPMQRPPVGRVQPPVLLDLEEAVAHGSSGAGDQERLLSSTPAATAEPITPATLGPIACMIR